MKKVVTVFIAAFLASSMGFAENANDVVMHSIPGAAKPDKNAVTNQQTPPTSPHKNANHGSNKIKKKKKNKKTTH